MEAGSSSWNLLWHCPRIRLCQLTFIHEAISWGTTLVSAAESGGRCNQYITRNSDTQTAPLPKPGCSWAPVPVEKSVDGRLPILSVSYAYQSSSHFLRLGPTVLATTIGMTKFCQMKEVARIRIVGERVCSSLDLSATGGWHTVRAVAPLPGTGPVQVVVLRCRKQHHRHQAYHLSTQPDEVHYVGSNVPQCNLSAFGPARRHCHNLMRQPGYLGSQKLLSESSQGAVLSQVQTSMLPSNLS